jgi:hypothetical protein
LWNFGWELLGFLFFAKKPNSKAQANNTKADPQPENKHLKREKKQAADSNKTND